MQDVSSCGLNALHALVEQQMVFANADRVLK